MIQKEKADRVCKGLQRFFPYAGYWLEHPDILFFWNFSPPGEKPNFHYIRMSYAKFYQSEAEDIVTSVFNDYSDSLC